MDQTGDTTDAVSDFDDISEKAISVRDEDVIALVIPLLAGELEIASSAARELLRRPQLFSWVWYPLALEYIANPTREAEEAMLRRAGPFSSDVQAAHFHVGMVAFARGEKEKAMRYFANVRETGKFDWAWANYADAFLARLNTDDTWPKWIDEFAR